MNYNSCLAYAAGELSDELLKAVDRAAFARTAYEFLWMEPGISTETASRSSERAELGLPFSSLLAADLRNGSIPAFGAHDVER